MGWGAPWAVGAAGLSPRSATQFLLSGVRRSILATTLPAGRLRLSESMRARFHIFLALCVGPPFGVRFSASFCPLLAAPAEVLESRHARHLGRGLA